MEVNYSKLNRDDIVVDLFESSGQLLKTNGT